MTECRQSARGPQTPPPWPAPALAWYAVGVLLLANVMSFVDRMILNLLIGPIRADLGISDTQVSLLIGLAFALFFTFMGLPLGRLADRVQRRRLIAYGVGAWSVMTCACGLASSFWGLFFARIGVGVGEATLSPAAFSIVSDYFPADRLGRALAVFSLGGPLGSGAALMIGGAVVNAVSGVAPVAIPVVGALSGWQLAFFCVGAPGLVVALLVLTLREPMRRGRVAATVSLRDARRFVWARRRIFGTHFGAVSMISIVMYGAVAWIPQFFVRTHGMNVGNVGLLYGAIFMVCGTAGLVLGGSLADRLQRRGRSDAHFRTILVAVLGALPLLVAAPLMPTSELALLTLAPALLVMSMFGGSAPAALQLVTPNELRGQVSALYFMTVTLVGLGVGPTLYAVATDYIFGYDAALRYSLALVNLLVLPLAAICLIFGRAAYARAVIEAGHGRPPL